MKILLNCDLGEGEAEDLTEALLGVVDLANIACGGHAGDKATMRRVVRAALAHGVQPGAHPGWPDRENFGRAALELGRRDLIGLMEEQVGALRQVVQAEGALLGHVKLHGALYHLCDERADLAEACVDWMYAEAEGCALVCGAGGLLQAVAEARGVPLLREIFADRSYLEEARLAPRGEPGALLSDATEAAQRIEDWKETGHLTIQGGRKWLVEAETVCLHADSPICLPLAKALREILG